MQDYHIWKLFGLKVDLRIYKGVVLNKETSTGTGVWSMGSNVTVYNTREDTLFLKMDNGDEEVVNIQNTNIAVRPGNTVSAFYVGRYGKNKRWAVALYNHDTRELYFSEWGAGWAIKHWNFGNLIIWYMINILIVIGLMFVLWEVFPPPRRGAGPHFFSMLISAAVPVYGYTTLRFILKQMRFARLKSLVRNLVS